MKVTFNDLHPDDQAAINDLDGLIVRWDAEHGEIDMGWINDLGDMVIHSSGHAEILAEYVAKVQALQEVVSRLLSQPCSYCGL